MRAFVLVAALLLASGVVAQQPREIVASDKIEMTVGETRRLPFDKPFKLIIFSQKDLTETITAFGDQEFAFVAKQPGITRLMVLGEDGKSLYDAEIFISPDRGRLVRLYNTGKNDDLNAGYVAVYCDPLGCSRPDKDLPPPTSVTINRHTYRGSGAGPVSRPPGGAGF